MEQLLRPGAHAGGKALGAKDLLSPAQRVLVEQQLGALAKADVKRLRMTHPAAPLPNETEVDTGTARNARKRERRARRK